MQKTEDTFHNSDSDTFHKILADTFDANFVENPEWTRR